MPPRLARPAIRDLDDIYNFGVERWGEERADAYLAEFWRMARSIVELPLLARLREEVQPPVRVRSYHAHVIVYELDDDGVVILRVAHGRSDWINHVR